VAKAAFNNALQYFQVYKAR